MPYATPAPTPLSDEPRPTPTPSSPLPVHSIGRPGHRRSYSSISFSDERGPGAFVPLAALPRRRSGSVQPTAPTPATPSSAHKFHLEDDESSEEEESTVKVEEAEDTEEERELLKKRLKIKVNNTFTPDPVPSPTLSQRRNQKEPQLSLPTIHTGVPFPRTSPLNSPLLAPNPANEGGVTSPRPNFSRTSSTPILLSNGKPLKSSLKSSSSSPHIPFPAQSLVPSLYQNKHHHHSRAASAPTTPHLSGGPSGEGTPEAQTQPNTPVIKNVHFPSQEEGGLATVRLFSRSAKPASLSKPAGEETETETETEGGGGFVGGYLRPTSVGGSGSNGYPFPKFRSSPLHEGKDKDEKVYEIDAEKSSTIPAPIPPVHANVFLESLSFNEPKMTPMGGKQPLSLNGTVIVKNLAYEKHVFLRFTLDEWQTTSEVRARHIVSLSSLPSSLPSTYSAPSTTVGDIIAQAEAPQWDRFGFTIRLEDYAPTLGERTMWLVAKYVAAGEWWDNNNGGNYRVGFKLKEKGEEERVTMGAMGRRTVVSLPSSAPQVPAAPQLTMSNSLPPYPSSSSNTFSASVGASSAAQTTLERLKKLNLRNYAAPSTSASSSPIVSTSSSNNFSTSTSASTSANASPPSATSSLPSTTLNTPTEGLSTPLPIPSTLMRMDGGYPATISPPFGASPPFSSFVSPGGQEKTGGVGEGRGVFWSWGSGAAANTKGNENKDDENKKDNDTDKNANASALPLPHPLPPALLMNIKEKSTSSPPRSPVRSVGPFSERTSSSESLSSGSGSGGERHGHGQRPKLPRSSTAPSAPGVVQRNRGGAPASASGSSSGSSGSDSRRRRFANGSTESPLRRSVLLNVEVSPSPLPNNGTSSPTSRSAPGSASGSPLGSGGGTPVEKQGGEDDMKDPDAIYQAFVRQWCFAQGPAPARGAEGGMGMVVG